MQLTKHTQQLSGRLPPHPLSRRRVLGGVAGSATLALAVGAGCTSSKSGNPSGPQSAGTTAGRASLSPTAVAKQPKRGGTLNHLSGSSGTDTFAAGFDPHVLNASFSAAMSLFYQGLLQQSPGNPQQPEPALAGKWEQPSPQEYVFHLVLTAKWQNKPPVNGRAVTADDAVFSLKRVGTNDPRYVNRSQVDNLDRVEAVDKATVRVTTKQPDVTTLLKLAYSSVAVLAPEVVDKAGKFATPETAVGTGPFMLQSFSASVSAALVRNPDYWKPGLPYLDGVHLLVQTDTQSQWAAFVASQLDQVIVPGTEVKNVLAATTKYATGWWGDHAPQYLWQNTQKKPFDDPRVTQALKLLMDHAEFITAWAEALFGQGSAYNTSHLSYLLKDWDFAPDEFSKLLEWKQPKDDAAKQALSLLSAAGFTKDAPLKFELTNISGGFSQPAGELMQAQFRRLGQGVVQPTLKLTDNATLIASQANGTTEVTGPVARASEFDPDQAFSQVYLTGASFNLGKYSDPTLDAMINKQRAIFDAGQRKLAVKQILTYLVDHAPYTTPCSRNVLNATPLKVQGFTPEPVYMFGHQYEHVWLDV